MMTTHIIRATEAVRDFSQLLSKVYYQGESFEIKRGKEVVAKLSPVSPTQKMHMSKLKDFFLSLPVLEKEDSQDFLKEVQTIRTKMKAPTNRWE